MPLDDYTEEDEEGEGEFYLNELKAIYAPNIENSTWVRLFRELLYKIGNSDSNFLTMELAPQQPEDSEEPRIYLLTLEGRSHFILQDMLVKEYKELKKNVR